MKEEINIRCILFDLGGVLVELREEEALMEMCPSLANPEEVRRAWFASTAVREFETGKIGLEEFCQRAMDDLGVEVARDVFQKAHSRFLGDPFPGVMDLLDTLRNHYILACLSNTNRAHIDALRNRSNILDELDHCFLSCETGLVKPDKEAFFHALKELEIEPHECLFLDDREKNVAAAKVAGLHAVRVSGIGAVQHCLFSAGLLMAQDR